MTLPAPLQQFFSIGDICALTELKPHVLRYWESQFRFLSPAKNRSGNRVYKARELELIMLVKHLLYTEKYTIEGARQRLDVFRKNGELKSAAREAMRYETVRDVRNTLDDVLAVLAGKPIPTRAPVEPAEPVVPAAPAVAVLPKSTPIGAPVGRGRVAEARKQPAAERDDDQLALG